ncbi:hypothetical protein [Oceanispirochaeta sp.]|jgi:hypothetical protein|uniref:hypothetical protein n=1 Tax=Oceanispirochaeta sp. TaxID=2035350 RepID=UPI00260F2DD5|nr:hypothetical protein [Oceanispirochaeta sp.]MDA3955697.1 hypothetical protein [Oceanispirochaeta sp.]
MEHQKNITLNRIVSFLIGGLLIFAIMNLTVLNNAKKENAQLVKSLDISQFEASRLLADAEAQFAAGDFEDAKLTLTTLFENQPGSTEAASGHPLLTKIEAKETTLNDKWEMALPGIRNEYYKVMASELRAESEADRVEFENELENNIDKAWKEEIDTIKSDWMNQS